MDSFWIKKETGYCAMFKRNPKKAKDLVEQGDWFIDIIRPGTFEMLTGIKPPKGPGFQVKRVGANWRRKKEK